MSVLVFDQEFEPVASTIELAPGVLVIDVEPTKHAREDPTTGDFLLFDGPPPMAIEETREADFLLIDAPAVEIQMQVAGEPLLPDQLITSGGPPGPPGPVGPGTHTRWYGEGPPGTIIGSSPGDEYVDTLTGDLYVLQ